MPQVAEMRKVACDRLDNLVRPGTNLGLVAEDQAKDHGLLDSLVRKAVAEFAVAVAAVASMIQ